MGITTEHIGVKYNNLKASWTAVRKKIGETGWGIKGGSTVSAELEKKCPFYERLGYSAHVQMCHWALHMIHSLRMAWLEALRARWGMLYDRGKGRYAV